MADKHTHHGEWADNWTYRDVVAVDDACLLDGGKDPAPDKIKVITPVNVGSTVFHTVDGKHCLFESLVDNNVTPPSKLAVLEGLWLSYCDLREVIDCVLPRVKLTDCKTNCDDPNDDGVVEGKTLCERVTTNTSNITKNTDSIVELDDCVFPVGKPSLCERVDCLTACCTSITGIPSGNVQASRGIPGLHQVDFQHDAPDFVGTPSTYSKWYREPFVLTVKVADYPYLAVAGRKINVTLTGYINYAADKLVDNQWATEVDFRGAPLSFDSEPVIIQNGNQWTMAMTLGATTIVTDGNDLVFNLHQTFYAIKGVDCIVQYDTCNALMSFAAEDINKGASC
jgi:hypothetical protein